MKSFIILIAICVLTWECTAQTDSISSHDYFRLYQLASGKLSSNYVVVNVTDMKTLRAKEISIEYKYLDRAIEMDHGETIIDEPNRIFKFFSDEALEYIDFFTFDSLKMIKCLENLSAEILLNNWKRNDIEFSNNYSGDCERYYAFVLFKHGILTGNGGVIKALHIIDGSQLERLKSKFKH